MSVNMTCISERLSVNTIFTCTIYPWKMIHLWFYNSCWKQYHIIFKCISYWYVISVAEVFYMKLFWSNKECLKIGYKIWLLPHVIPLNQNYNLYTSVSSWNKNILCGNFVMKFDSRLFAWLLITIMGQDSVVGIVICLWAGSSGDRILVGARYATPAMTSHGAHPASYSVLSEFFLGVKWPGHGIDHPPPSSTEQWG